MKPHFYYHSIGEVSARQLSKHLDRGESVVVIGPRGSGKRYLLEYVNRLRAKAGKQQFPSVALGASTVISLEQTVAQSLADGAKLGIKSSVEAWADAVRIERTSADPLCLFVTNLDGVSKTLAHRVLTSIQSLVKAGVLVVVVTGEGNLIDLVDGSPTSAWGCAHQFLVHAHDRRHFHRFLTKRLRQCSLALPAKLSEAKELVQLLFRRTGGDVSLLRAVLWGIGDDLNFHFRHPEKGRRTRLSRDIIPQKITDIHIVPVAGVIPFHYGCTCVFAAAREPSPLDRHSATRYSLRNRVPALYDLETMLWRREPVKVSDEPHLLELAGLAAREDGQLRWFSPYTEAFVTDYFSKRCVADLFAFAHEWDTAYRLYREVNLEEKQRPLSDIDHLSLLRLMDGAAIRFHRIASYATPGHRTAETIHELRLQLRQALQHVNGVIEENISFWALDWLGRWVCTLKVGTPSELPPQVASAWNALASKPPFRLAEDDLHRSQDGYHWAICRDYDNLPSSAVLIDGTDDPLRDHPMRTHAIHRLLRGYRRAREHCLMANHALRERAEHEILKAFWLHTKRATWEDESLLQTIAQPILESLSTSDRIVYLAYGHPQPENRTLIPLYDTDSPNRTVHEYSPFHSPSVFDPLSLEPEGFSLTAAAINQFGRPSGLTPFRRTVACIKLPGIKGLLIFQYAENQAFSQADFRFIKHLAERIKPSWDQGLRLKLLHESIDANQSPSLLLDRNRRILFSNKQACNLLQLRLPESGWQAAPASIDCLGLPSSVLHALAPTSSRESREVINATERMNGTWLRECYPLVGGGGKPRGWVLTFRDRALLYQSFDLLRRLEATNDYEQAMRQIMESIQTWLRVRTPKLRFYRIDPENPNRLIGKFSTGLNEENTTLFEQGAVVWNQKSDEPAWLCIHRKEPIALKLTEGGDVGRQGQTPKGLKFVGIAWNNEFSVLERKPGDLSVDLPLLCDANALGKLTINFQVEDVNDLPAELPMQLGALSVVLGGLLDRVRREEARRREILTDATENALHTTAHNLLSQISPFAAFIARYRLCEPVCPELKAINDDLTSFHEQARQSVRRIKDRIGSVKLECKTANIVVLIESALRTVVYENGEWKWARDPEPVIGLWDQNHLSNAFIELAHNSLDFGKPGRALQITLSLTTTFRDSVRWANLRFGDNGQGIPAELKNRIFEGHSSREASGETGRGIGLTYVRRVIEAHGGRIREVGTEGDGALFEISMPVRAP